MQVDEGRSHGPAILEPGLPDSPPLPNMATIARTRPPRPRRPRPEGRVLVQTLRGSTNPLHRRGFRACRPRRAVRNGREGTGARPARSRQVVAATVRRILTARAYHRARAVALVPASRGAPRRRAARSPRRRHRHRARAEPRRRAAGGDHGLWGTWGLYHQPYAVLDVHRAYVDAGCDVVSTDTWSILGASALEAGGLVGGPGRRTGWTSRASESA